MDGIVGGMKLNKYRNRKTTKNGIQYDSVRESRRHAELLLLERAGEISELARQVRYILLPAQYESDIIGPKGGVKRGKLIEREVSYIADFVYMQDGKLVVEDTKGVRTKDYIIKRKLMLYVHKIRIKEV